MKYFANLLCSLTLACVAFTTDANGQPPIPPQSIMGRNVCVKCHEAELNAWKRSSHATKAFQLLDHPKAKGFADAIGENDIKGNSSCTKCHGTQMVQGGKLFVAQGNSCESCHGGSGPKQGGWLTLHCDYRVNPVVADMKKLLLDRPKETPANRAARDAACVKRRMNRSEDAYQIARNCLQCHLVPNEKLVDAGHPTSERFEFVEWAQGEVRHNFLLNPNKNAEVPSNWLDPVRHGPGRTADARKRLMTVSGQLADLDISLRIRATVTSTKRGSLGRDMADRILDARDELQGFNVPDLAPVLAVVNALDKKGLREIKDNDKQVYTELATKVSIASLAFTKKHADGSQLPKTIKFANKAKGRAP